MERFVQTFAPLPDLYASDHALRGTLDRLLGEDGHAIAKGQLNALAADAAGPLRAAHVDAEAHPPELIRYDGWGRRVDAVRTSAGWETLRRAAAEYGLVALPYDDDARKVWGAGARVVQHALLHLYGPESATFTCPVAMADGAAALLSRPDTDPAVRDAWLPRLTARDPERATCSGQWMTETTGGSDVGKTETIARRDEDGTWRLYGTKWFTSATTSEIALTLARPEGAPEGSRGLSLFRVHRRDDDGRSNGIVVRRLKDKLGTRSLPTAELELNGAVARPVGPTDGRGLRRIATMLNLTRIHNALNAAGALARGLAWARAFADVRDVGGRPLGSLPGPPWPTSPSTMPPRWLSS